MNVKSEIKIGVIGCKDNTFEFLNEIINYGIEINLLITINSQTAKRNKVSGYYDLSEYASKKNIEVYVCDSYSLNSRKDKDFLSNRNLDILFVASWQRLLPSWLLESLGFGAFGMHGSSQPLPFGRGRSPLNWSLIQDKDRFITNLFQYNEGIDAGNILGSQDFDINEFDDAKSCHYKNILSMIKIVKDNFKSIRDNQFSLKKQMSTRPSYYPKRDEEDGVIFWERSTREIYNLIRAVTKPFPGAITFLDKHKIKIWKATPFDTRLFKDTTISGKILHVFLNEDFVVKTGTDSMLVTDYVCSAPKVIKKGAILNSLDYSYVNPFVYPTEDKNC